MFNWLISSKKNKNSSDDKQGEQLENHFFAPNPPEADWELAVKIKKQKYNYLLCRDDLKPEIIEEYYRRQRKNNIVDIDKKLHNLLMSVVFMEMEQRNNRQTIPSQLKFEIIKEYNRREIIRDDKSLHKILLRMVNNEIISSNDNINVKYFEWSSEESDSEHLESDSEHLDNNSEHEIEQHVNSEDEVESDTSEEFISKEYARRMKRLREELPIIDWEKKVKEWGNMESEFPEEFDFQNNALYNTDIEMGFAPMEEVVVDNGIVQVEKFKLTEEDMQRISDEIGNSWDKLDEYTFSFDKPQEKQEPLNIELDDNFDFTVKETDTNNKMKVNKEHPEGYLELFIGPMYSGKSSKVLFKLSSMADQRFNCLYINSNKDERETEAQDDFVTTHNSAYSRSSPKIKCVKVSSLKEVSVSDYDYIGIDELQFFNDDDTVNCINDWVSVYGKHVLIASLDADCYRRRFGNVLDLVPNADEVTKLTAYCDLCRDNYGVVKKAPFTARMTSDKSAELVGGRNLYKAMCRSCHDYHLNITAIDDC